MATEKQLAANRENAKKSTGPRTPEGKAVSCMNAVTDGFASSTKFIKGEKQEDLDTLYRNLHEELKPATHVEQILVEKMIHNQWLSLRAIRLQSARLTGKQPWEELPKDLGLLIRYQTAADRAFHRAYSELLKLQKERQKSEIGFVREDAAQTPQPVPATTIEVASEPLTAVEIDSTQEKTQQKLDTDVAKVRRAA